MPTAYPAPADSTPSPRESESSSPEEFIALHVRGSIQVKPVPVAAVRRIGPRPLRVLLFGGGPLIGWGLRDHNVGLAGNVADQLAAASRRGVEMEVVADGEPARQAAVAGFRGLRLWRFDAVVVVLGQPCGKGTALDQAYWTSELVRALLVDGSPTAALSVYDSSLTVEPPKSVWARPVARLAQTQRDAAELACARTGRIRFGELTSPLRVPSPGRPFESMQFAHWGEQIVHRLMQQVDDLRAANPVPAALPRQEDERFRQRALESLRIGRDGNERLDWIVNAALTRFGAAGAAINIIDRELQWSKASVPFNPDIPREIAYCAHAIHHDGSTLINDARSDERLVGNPLVDRIRFYAAHPIRSWDGYRIGTLCVYGLEPRTMRPSELAPLRDLAGLVEQELWAGALRPLGDLR
ncbi:MAG: hypothetical protein HIU86_10270 [Acidobacteria bacterium]|nr:hypothetical protein [Acidobacteriota bacterium]